MNASETSAETERFPHIIQIIETLNLTHPDDVRSTAESICQDAADTTLSHGIDAIHLESAAVCLACRMEGEPWGAKDISTIADVSKQHIRSVSWKLNSTLSIEVPPHDPQAYIDRYCTELDVSEAIKERAHMIIDACPPHFNSGTPTGIAASAIYGASSQLNGGLTQREIAETADVSEVTIRNWYSEQLAHYQTQT